MAPVACRACRYENTTELWRSWTTRASVDFCPGCLTLHRRSAEGADEAEFSGAVILQTRDQLASLSIADLRLEVERLAEDEARFVLLRAPQIFEVARRILGERAVLSRAAEHAVPALPEAVREVLRGAMEPVEQGQTFEAFQERMAAVTRAALETAPGEAVDLERYERGTPGAPRIVEGARTAGMRGVSFRGMEFSVIGCTGVRVLLETKPRPGLRLPTPARFRAPLDLLAPLGVAGV